MESSVSDKSFFVSVIIPVFNDAERLALCLEALQLQKNEQLNLEHEVIIVDNNSTEDIKQVCQLYGAKYVLEIKKGSYAARNAGIQEAKSKYLAFTDSDCIPDLFWLERGVTALLENPQVSMIGGDIKVFTKNARQTLGDTFDLAFAFPQHTYIHRNHFAATANMFTTKNVFDQVGFFNNHMASGGDYEWGQRVHQAGLKQGFASQAIVKHPTRSSIKEIINKSIRVNSNYYRKYHQGKASYKHLIKHVYEFFGIHIPIYRSYKKLRNANKHRSLSFFQNFRLAFLLIFVYYVELFSKIREWFKLKTHI